MKDSKPEALEIEEDRLQPEASPSSGWRKVFGQARREDVEPVDALIAAEFSTLDPDPSEDWAESTENDPRFLRRIEESRQEIREGKGIRVEDLDD